MKQTQNGYLLVDAEIGAIATDPRWIASTPATTVAGSAAMTDISTGAIRALSIAAIVLIGVAAVLIRNFSFNRERTAAYWERAKRDGSSRPLVRATGLREVGQFRLRRGAKQICFATIT